jgi:hypothetical protein
MTEKSATRKYLLCTGKFVTYDKLHEHPGAHTMGHIGYAVSYGRTVTVFKRWKNSIPTDEVLPLESEFEVVIGDVRGMFCRHAGCARKQDWYASRAATVALFVERYGFSEEALNAVQGDDDGGKEVVGTTGRRDPHEALQPQDG